MKIETLAHWSLLVPFGMSTDTLHQLLYLSQASYLLHRLLGLGLPMQTAEISQAFMRFYQQRGYSMLPSAPLLDPSVPMSFVMSAGLVQVENSLGELRAHSNRKFVLRQRCFRHFDVERVGLDDRHLSFFEMPGAFAFGDIAREVALGQLWQLLTNVLSLDPRRLWLTYFIGGEKSGYVFAHDEETQRAWLAVGVSQERLLGLGPEHNLWVQGDGLTDRGEIRKAGPNTEVFWDRGAQCGCSPSCQPGCSCGRFVEIANCLFITHHINKAVSELGFLDEPFFETVIGLERVSMLAQGLESVFDTDGFVPIMQRLEAARNGHHLDPAARRQNERIIADHLRALLHLVADGAPPPWGENGDKGGRHRLVRILVRRVLTSQMILSINQDGFLATALDGVIEADDDRPRLTAARDTLLCYFARESMRFQDTLRSAEKCLFSLLAANPGRVLSGGHGLLLEKRYGMPKALLEQKLNECDMMLDRPGYELALRRWEAEIAEQA